MSLERHIGGFGCHALWSFAVMSAGLVGVRSMTDGIAGVSSAAAAALCLSVGILTVLSLAGWAPGKRSPNLVFVVAFSGPASMAFALGIARLEAAMGWRAWVMLGVAAAVEVGLIVYGYVQQKRLTSQSVGVGA